MFRTAQFSPLRLGALVGLALLAACTAETPPPAPIPVVANVAPTPLPAPIPARPVPPAGAALNMVLPPVGPNGVRMTVNANLNPQEAVWNFRSGWNVAALNCLDARYQPILDGYKALLSKHSKRLTKINSDIDKQYRARHGGGATRARETYLTQVYNYFAMPPAHNYFCEAALALSQEALASPPADIDAFALAGLPRFEAAFERFFQDMERYRIAVASWDAQYGSLYAPSPFIASAAQTSASYGPTEPSLDLTVPRATAEDFILTPTYTSQPVLQPVPQGSN